MKSRNLKESILQLKSEGKSQYEIKQILQCSSSTVSYHCDENQKVKSQNRTKEFKSQNPLSTKVTTFKGRKLLYSKTRDFQRRSGSSNDVTQNTFNFTTKDVLEKFDKNPYCYLTGDKLDIKDPSSFALDHCVPATRGGDNSLENLQFCLPQVNIMKDNLTHEEFVLFCLKVVKHHGYSVSDKFH